MANTNKSRCYLAVDLDFLFFSITVESRYLEVHGTVTKFRVIRNST